MNYFKLFFSNNSILRILQNDKFRKYKFKGLCLELGANYKTDRNFLNIKSKKYKTVYSNIEKKRKDYLFLDLQKKLNHKKKYDNIVVFNVLEHLNNLDSSLQNLFSLLKKGGRVLGSTPFIYRIHGAPKDYNRFTKDYLIQILKEKKFKKIEVEELGLGPFLASFSLLRGFFKYLPIIYQFLLILCVFIDKTLFFIMKTDPKKIYPIGYIFSAYK